MQSDKNWYCFHCDTSKLDVEIEARGYGERARKIISSENYLPPKTLKQCMNIALEHTIQDRPNLRKDAKLASSAAFFLSNELEIAESLRNYPAVQLVLGNVNEHLKRSISKHSKVKRMNELCSLKKLKFTVISNSSSDGVTATFDGFGLETLANDIVDDWLDFRCWLNKAAKNTDLVIQERFESYDFKRL